MCIRDEFASRDIPDDSHCTSLSFSRAGVTSQWIAGNAPYLARRVAMYFPILGDPGDGASLLTRMCTGGDPAMFDEGIKALLDGLKSDPPTTHFPTR